MKKVLKIIIFIVLILTVMSSFNFCYAAIQTQDGVGGKTGGKKQESITDESITDAFSDGSEFINNGKSAAGDVGKEIKESADTIYNILLAIGVVLAVIIGGILGIQFMISSVEDKAKIKEALIPYVVGCVVIFGAFAIWKIVVGVLNQIS